MRKLMNWIGFSLLTLIGIGAYGVINGEKLTSNEAVESIYIGSPQFNSIGGSCTGVIVAPHLILTAAHCVQFLTDSTLQYSSRSPILNAMALRQNPDALRSYLSSTRVIKRGMHPKFEKTNEQLAMKATNIQYDIGYFVVEDDLTRTLSHLQFPALLGDHQAALDLLSHAQASAVGYGLSMPAGLTLANANFFKRTVRQALDSEEGLHFYLMKSLEAGRNVCSGDSGAGLFVQNGSTRYLVGIYSSTGDFEPNSTFRVPKDCGTDRQRAAYVEVADHLCWLKSETGISLSQNLKCD